MPSLALRAWGVSVALACACGEGPEAPVEVDTDPLPVDTDLLPRPNDTGLNDPCDWHTWQTVGQPFLTTWCAPCHGGGLGPAQRQGAPVDVVIDTEDQAIQFASRIRARTLGDEVQMPPVGAPSDAERERMAAYLDCVAPP